MSGELFGAALAASLVCASAAWAQQDCSLKQIASLPITTTASGKIAVPVKIDGKDKLLAVELGAATSGINANLISELQLDTSPIPGAQVPAHLEDILMMPSEFPFVYQDPEFTKGVMTSIMRKVTLPDFQIGALAIKNMPVTALPAWDDPDGVVGILGTGILRHFDVELDFANAKMNLYGPDHCPGKVVYWTNAYAIAPITINGLTGEIMSDETLDGIPLKVSYSTDPGHGSMALVVAVKLLNISIGAPDLKKMGQVNDREVYQYPFKTLSIDGLDLTNPKIDLVANDGCGETKAHGTVFIPNTKNAALLCATDLTLQLDELRKLHLYFAFGENKLYVTAADAHR